MYKRILEFFLVLSNYNDFIAVCYFCVLCMCVYKTLNWLKGLRVTDTINTKPSFKLRFFMYEIY